MHFLGPSMKILLIERIKPSSNESYTSSSHMTTRAVSLVKPNPNLTRDAEMLAEISALK